MTENKGSYEIITRSIIQNKLNNLEAKSENLMALGMLNLTQNRINEGLKELIEKGKVPKIKLALKYNEKTGAYRIFSGKYTLKLDLKFKGSGLNDKNQLLSNELGLEGILPILEKIYLAKGTIFDRVNTIKLNGKQDWRRISEKYLTSDKNTTILYKGVDPNLSKEKLIEINNQTETIYKFIQLTKGIPIEEWDVEDSLYNHKEGKLSLGIPENKNKDFTYAEK